jgi:hypothetical protein
MGRFSISSTPVFSTEAPKDGLGPSRPEQPVKKEAAVAKEPDREKQSQEPVRKTEGGRYDDIDYSNLA